MAWFSRKIAVTFINDATGEAFANTKMSPSDFLKVSMRNSPAHQLGDEGLSLVVLSLEVCA